jgi:hypothetical protein
MTTGLVSPQFHAKFNDEFETVTGKQENMSSLWQRKCHFESEEEVNTKDHHIPMVQVMQPTPSKVVESLKKGQREENQEPQQEDQPGNPEEINRVDQPIDNLPDPIEDPPASESQDQGAYLDHQHPSHKK